MKTKHRYIRFLIMLLLSLSALGAWAQNDISPTQTVCIGNEPYRVDATPGSTYNWDINIGVSGTDWTITGNGNPNISVNWITPNLSTGYILKVIETSVNNCIGAEIPVTVFVNPIPVLTDPDDPTTCSGAKTNIPLATTTTGATVLYTWTVTGSSANVSGFSNQATAVAGPIAQTLSNSGLTVETVTYLVTPLIGTCAGTPVTVIVTVNPVPVMNDPSDEIICAAGNTNIVLVSNNTGVTVKYIWTVTGSSTNVTGFSNQATSVIGPIVQSLTNSGLVFETVTYAITPVIGTCNGTASKVVVVNVNPIVITSPIYHN